jgi:hypothetical protein
VGLILREAKLFKAVAKNDPKIAMQQLVELEQALKKATNQ